MYFISQCFFVYFACAVSSKAQELEILQGSGCIYITAGDCSIILILLKVTGESIVSMPWEKVVNLIIELLYKRTAANTCFSGPPHPFFSPLLLF